MGSEAISTQEVFALPVCLDLDEAWQEREEPSVCEAGGFILDKNKIPMRKRSAERKIIMILSIW